MPLPTGLLQNGQDATTGDVADAEVYVLILTTTELSVLKEPDYPNYADAYRRLSHEKRSQYLSETIAPVPRSKVTVL